MSEASLATSQTSKLPTTVLWIAQIGLALMFGMAGAMKSTAPISELATQMAWVAEAPPALVRFIGVSELLGAIGLVLPSALRIAPKLTPLAAVGLTIVMVLAAGFHAMQGDPPFMLAVNAVLGGVAAAIAWGRLRVAPIPPRS